MSLRAVCAVIATTTCASAADPVAEFGRNYPAFQRGQLTAVAKISYDPKTPPNTSRTTRVYVDLPRWKLVDRESTTSLKDGKTSTYSLQGESLVHSGGSISVSANFETGKAFGGVAAYVKTLPPDKARWSGFGAFSFSLDGRTQMNDAHPLAEILARSKTTTDDGLHDGKKVVVVVGEGEWGKLSLWLDPARSYLPLKVVQEKGGGHLIDGNKPLRSVVRNEDGKPSPLAEFVQQYETTRVETVRGRDMVTGFTHRLTERASDGTSREERTSVLLSDIKPVEKWDRDPFVPTTVIPDGMRVTAQDDQPIEYEWRGGKAVKKVSQAVVASAGSQQFAPPAESANWWLWPAGGAVVLAAAAGVFWGARRAGRAA